MKARVIAVFTLSLFALALLFTAAAPAVPATPAPSPAPAAVPDHPQIHDAISALRNAKGHLEAAKHDYGGHRAAAVSAINSAIEQLQVCLKYD